MRISPLLKTVSLSAVLSAAGLLTTLAQTTANWIGASGGEWNTGANWDAGSPPLDSTTNAFIGSGLVVNYNIPMAAASFGSLTNFGTLNIGTNGFNCSAIYVNLPGGTADVLNIANPGAAVTVSGPVILGTNGQGTLAAGASLTAGSFGVSSGLTTKSAGTSAFTNNGGAFSANSTTVGGSTSTGTGRMVISGGTNFLGNTSVGRYSAASASTLGAEGLSISGGLVTMSNLTASAASYGTAYIANGIVTNFGNVSINGATAGRYLRVVQAGGLFVVPDPGIIYENATTAGTETARYQVTGGTNIIGGIYLGASNGTVAATVTVTVGGAMYVGSQGINTNGAVISTVTLSGGGLLGATADWSGNANLSVGSGTFTLNAADLGGAPHNITLTGVLSGAGTVSKTGAGMLTLSGANTYSGSTIISNGIVALGAGGSLASSPIVVNDGTAFDVTAAGMTLASGKTLSGKGSVLGAFTAGNNSVLAPGGVGAQGTLTFSNGLTAIGANFSMELTDDTTGLVKANDVINIIGDLNASSVNTIVITPVGSLAPGTYRLLKYSGNFNGNLSNFSCISGTLSNPPGEIDLTVTSVRPTEHLTWRGDGAGNIWDAGVSSNWFNGTALDRFYTGDTNVFDDSTTNFIVTIASVVSPAASSAVLVSATHDYVLTGSGDITGTTGLTKTNSGNLTILAVNDYTGVTTLGGGTLTVSNLANGGVSSPIGAAGNLSANLVFNGGTLAYLGANTTIDRGATLLAGNGTLNVVSNVTLTLSGALTGPGALIENGNGQVTLTGGNNYSGGTVINGGNLRANPAATIGTNLLTLAGGTNAAIFAFAGDAQVLNNTLNVIGTNNYLTMNGNDTMSAATGNGSVMLNGAAGNILTLQAADMSGFSGKFTLSTLSTLRIFPSSGTALNASGATFDLGTGTGLLNNRNGGVYRLGALAGGPNTQLRGSANSGTAATTYIIGANNQTTVFGGAIATGAGGSGASVSLVKAGTGTLTLNGGFTPVVGLDGNFNLVTNNNYANLITYNGSTIISNGVLAIAAPAVLTTSPTITLAAPTATLDASQMGYADSTGTNLIITGIFELVSGQTLNGLGTLRGSLVADAGSTLNGGLFGITGVLNVTNSITLNGTTTMKLNRGASPASDELVAVQSFISYGGTLIVTNIGGPLQAGDVFTLFSAASSVYNNTFSSIVLPDNATWDTTQLAVNGTIRVVSAAGPPALSATDFSQLANGAITLHAVNGPPNGPASVLSSTNLALPLAQWTSVATGNFDANGNYSPTITVNPTAPQAYYILQAQ
jgi:fibronectin-binding autotransporter adhesin